MKPVKMSMWQTWTGRGEIADLSVKRGSDGALYSRWRPSLGERFRVLLGESVIVGVLAERQPPITVIVGLSNIPSERNSSESGMTGVEVVIVMALLSLASAGMMTADAPTTVLLRRAEKAEAALAEAIADGDKKEGAINLAIKMEKERDLALAQLGEARGALEKVICSLAGTRYVFDLVKATIKDMPKGPDWEGIIVSLDEDYETLQNALAPQGK